MKKIRWGIYLLFLCSLVLYIMTFVIHPENSGNCPIISADEDELHISYKDGNNDEVLLQGLTAIDQEDGNLTDKIVLTEKAEILEPGVVQMTCTVTDSDNNMGIYSRIIYYKDYKAPKFQIFAEPLCYVNQELNIADFITIKDEIDGNLLESVKVDTSELNLNESGIYPITLQVSNSMNDTVVYPMFVHVKVPTSNRVAVILKKNAVTLKKGAEFDPDDYVETVLNSVGDAIVNPDLNIENNVNTDEAGIYSVIYELRNFYVDSRAVLRVEVKE